MKSAGSVRGEYFIACYGRAILPLSFVLLERMTQTSAESGQNEGVILLFSSTSFASSYNEWGHTEIGRKVNGRFYHILDPEMAGV